MPSARGVEYSVRGCAELRCSTLVLMDMTLEAVGNVAQNAQRTEHTAAYAEMAYWLVEKAQPLRLE